jgi:hypothetical protein
MGQPAKYTIVIDTADRLIIRDDGPWDAHLTVTNDAERVVRELSSRLNGRRLLYFDSTGTLDEILLAGGVFLGFVREIDGDARPPERNEARDMKPWGRDVRLGDGATNWELRPGDDRDDVQMISLALAELSLSRPGFEYAIREIAKKMRAEEIFDGMRKANADRVSPAGHKSMMRGGELAPANDLISPRKLEALKAWYSLFVTLIDANEPPAWVLDKLRGLREQIRKEYPDAP